MRSYATPFLLSLLISAGASAAQAQTALPSGSTHYGIYQGDKSVGSTDATIQTASGGYTVTSQGKFNLSKFSYTFNNAQKLDSGLNLVHDELSGTVKGDHVTFTAAADPTGKQFQININAKGKPTQNTVDRHQHLVLLTDLDPAGYMLLTRIVVQNPATSWALIPKQDGLLVPTSILRDAAVHGQLNGAAVDVQHATVALSAENSVNIELFYTADGQLLEADLPQQNFFVIHDGFKLTDRPQPAAPRAPGAPLPDKQQQQQPQTQQPSQSAPQYPAPQGGYPQTQPQ